MANLNLAFHLLVYGGVLFRCDGQGVAAGLNFCEDIAIMGLSFIPFDTAPLTIGILTVGQS